MHGCLCRSRGLCAQPQLVWAGSSSAPAHGAGYRVQDTGCRTPRVRLPAHRSNTGRRVPPSAYHRTHPPPTGCRVQGPQPAGCRVWLSVSFMPRRWPCCPRPPPHQLSPPRPLEQAGGGGREGGVGGCAAILYTLCPVPCTLYWRVRSLDLVLGHLLGQLLLIVVYAAIVLAHALVLAHPDLLCHLVDETEIVRN